MKRLFLFSLLIGVCAACAKEQPPPEVDNPLKATDNVILVCAQQGVRDLPVHITTHSPISGLESSYELQMMNNRGCIFWELTWRYNRSEHVIILDPSPRESKHLDLWYVPSGEKIDQYAKDHEFIRVNPTGERFDFMVVRSKSPNIIMLDEERKRLVAHSAYYKGLGHITIEHIKREPKTEPANTPSSATRTNSSP